MRRNIGLDLTAVAATLFLSSSFAHAQSAEIGIDALNARLGATAPTGMGVVVGQTEAPDAGNYGPNQSDIQFSGKTFIAQSGPPGNSSHATLVGQNMYGSSSGMAPGVSTIYLYEASSWVQSAHLRFGQGSGSPPLLPPGGLKIFNNSWVGSFANAAIDNEVLRRADFAARRDQLIVCNGVNNQGFGSQQPLMCHMFNAISVGLSNGAHVSGGTLAAYDGPGRMKPELVAPSQLTSFATPYVSAIAARLVQTARTAPHSSNANAERSETIKAAMMTGANHRTTWSNNPATSGPTRGITATPLDPHYGADVVFADSAHLILTGMEQNGATSPPASTNIIRRGWDFASVPALGSMYYRFRISALADKVSVLATWNRVVDTNLISWSLADFNLQLHRVDTNGQLVSLTGNAGLAFFSSGNVVSQSAVDNVEHLYIQNLQPGEYAIQLSRIDALGGNRDVAIAWLLPKKPGDVNEDGTVNVSDLLAVINGWGNCPPPCLPACPADVTGDCMVNVSDLLAVINNWG